MEDALLLLPAANVSSQQLYVFAMNNKASIFLSTRPTDRCSCLYPYFPSSENRLAGGQLVERWTGKRVVSGERCGSGQLMELISFSSVWSESGKNGRKEVARPTVLYRAIHKSLWDFRTLQYNNHDRHSRKEHINR
jgi:hypothetical protein